MNKIAYGVWLTVASLLVVACGSDDGSGGSGAAGAAGTGGSAGSSGNAGTLPSECAAPGDTCVNHEDCGSWKCKCSDSTYPIHTRQCEPKTRTCVLELTACDAICGSDDVGAETSYEGCE